MPGSQQGARKNGAGQAHAKYRAQQFVSIGNFRDVVQPAGVKGGSAQHENGGVDEKRESQRDRGIKDRVAQRFAAMSDGDAKGARLHNAGVQIQIVRHDRGTQNADGDVQHFAIPENFRARNNSLQRVAPQRLCEENFVGKAGGNGGDQGHHESFDKPESPALHGQHNQDIQRGNQHAGEQRQTEEQL